MTDNEIVKFINLTPALKKLWAQLTPDGRREVLRQADGDTWHLEEVIQGVIDDAVEQT